MTGNLVPSNGSSNLDRPEGGLPQPFGGDAYDVAPPPPEEGIQWGRYISALRRYKWLMLLVVLLGTAIGVGITQFLQPEYQVRSTLWIDNSGGRSGPIQSGDLVQGTAWVELLQSFAVVDSVVLKQSLFVEPNTLADSVLFRNFRLGRRTQPGKYQLKINAAGDRYSLSSAGGTEVETGTVGDSVGRKIGMLWQPPKRQLGKDRTIKFTLLTPREASNSLRQRLGVGMAEKSNFLRLSLRDIDPYRAAATLNAIDTQFVNLAADLKKKQLTELTATLKEQLDTVTHQREAAEEALQRYRISVITSPTQEVALSPGIAQTQAPVMTSYFNKKVQLDQIRKDRQSIEDILSRLKTGESTVDAFQTIGIVRTSPNLNGALTELSQKEAELRALRYHYTEDHKPVQDVKGMIQTLREQTIPEYAMALVIQLKSQESALGRELAAEEAELKSIPTQQLEEQRLVREVDAKTNLEKELRNRYETNELAMKSAVPDVSILDEAQPPTRPTSNTAPRIILMAFMASLGAAVALALLLDQLDKRFRYPEQVTQELGLHILGAIPAIRRTNGRALKPEEAAQVVEAFRTVRLNLAHSYGSAGPVMLTVSSPGSGDGKSLVSSNLALSFAEAGYRTLLVDGDIRRGELHRMFTVDRRPGLLDYLMGDVDLDAVVRESGHDGLSIVPCGTRRQQGPELLGSSAMQHLMAEMKTRFNVIIVDSPPLGAGIDPFVLGTSTGNLLLVFRSGETDRQMAEAKLKLLERLPVRVLGAVLNDISADGVYRYYSYLYGYSSEDDQAAKQLTAQTAEVSSKS
ncbi:MAG: GumC family protein [Gemmatimonadales bacterium]